MDHQYSDLMEQKMVEPSIDRSTDAMPEQDNIADDKSNSLDDYHAQNKTDTPANKPSVDTDEPLVEMSEVDIAYQILAKSGKDNPMYFKPLILEVLAKKNKAVHNEASAISEIYTMINMDSRFQHVGDGKWGLSDWYPPETKRSRSSTKTAKSAS